MDLALSTLGDVAAIDPFAPEYRADPHPIYHRLRQLDPVHRLPGTRDWTVFRHADATAVLRDPRFSADPAHLPPDAQPIAGPRRVESKVLLFLDPPNHTRIRSLVSAAFTPARVRRLRTRVEELVSDLLDRAEAKGSLEVIGDLAYPLPVAVICELLGVPADADQATFRRWASDATRRLDGELDVDPESWARGEEAVASFIQYFITLINQRREQPEDGLLDALIAAEQAGDRLDPEELLAIVILLFLAGHETTMNLIGNGLWALLRHPDQLERLRRDPSLGPGAVEELLRYDGPVHVTSRIATEDLRVAGTPIRKGEQVIVVLAAANRDPAVFADPDRLDLGRRENRHLTFSAGMHYCLGAALAQLEGEVAIGALLRRFPTLALAGPEPVYRDHFVLRGLRSLELSV
ncbi:MAG TPA: cytochrome P450 [Actinomycetota bacterium]